MNPIDQMKPLLRAARLDFRLITSATRVLPDFLIIGGQRCGTTSLYFYLLEHGGIVPALNKEVHFFDDHFNKGLSWYRAQFSSSLYKHYIERRGRIPFITGESSPYYLFHPRIPGRIAEVLPGVKLIVLLRNPVDRAYSHHWLEAKWRTETLPFEVAIHAEAERLAGEREKMLENEDYESYNYRHFSYLSRGVYIDQLRVWMSFFPKEQFLILRSEDLYSNPAGTLQQTLLFLGMPASAVKVRDGEFKQYREPNPRGYKQYEKPPKMEQELRKYLVEYSNPIMPTFMSLQGEIFNGIRKRSSLFMKIIDKEIVSKLYRGMTSPLRLLPDFVIIGAQKGGTTSLYNYLLEHHGIVPSFAKEAHFFDKNFKKGAGWYRAHFPTSLHKYYTENIRKQRFITGESTPYYLFHPHAPGRIARILPQAKFIVLLRNPVDRAYSQYAHQVRQKYETLSFEEALEREEERTAQEREKILQIEDYVSFNDQHYTYLARGVYIEQIQRWMKFFPKERFLILKSEDFYADPATAVQQTIAFLEVPDSGWSAGKKEFQVYNTGGRYSGMEPALRERLLDYYKPYNTRLYEFLGVDFGWDR